MRERVVIAGAGQAGARTAVALRKEGWQGDILLLGAEAEPPYERPPLSKQVLSDGVDPLKATILSEARCAALEIELWKGQAVSGLDRNRREVFVADGPVRYDKLVLATGSRARNLKIPGADLANVYSLRTAADARAIRPQLQPGASVVLVGGGFIGLEVAASAIKRGCTVTVLETAPQLMGRVLNPQLADVVTDMHRSRGVDVRLGVRIESFEGLQAVRRVRLADGSAVDADLVVVGVGALANDGLAMKAGIECADGIMVDGLARSSDPHVFAVGDVARHRSIWSGTGVRLESWENAELQAQTAGRGILGEPSVTRGAPWFWTDQFDMNLQILGFRSTGDATVVRGSLADSSWCAFMLNDGKIVGACLVNSGRDRRIVSQLMSERRRMEARDLMDAQRPLKTLLAAA